MSTLAISMAGSMLIKNHEHMTYDRLIPVKGMSSIKYIERVHDTYVLSVEGMLR